jgi:tRNA threonylcarbamoyladenosine biosynthesis protein TsaE
MLDMRESFFCAGEAATAGLGKLLASCLASGDFVCLKGELGAGKTVFAKGVAAGLGIDPLSVTSPTFTLMQEYAGRETLRHFDLYRLSSAEELEAIGFDQHIAEAGVTLVEWGDLFPSALPPCRLTVHISPQGEGRAIVLRPQGARYEELCREMAHAYPGD